MDGASGPAMDTDVKPSEASIGPQSAERDADGPCGGSRSPPPPTEAKLDEGSAADVGGRVDAQCDRAKVALEAETSGDEIPLSAWSRLKRKRAKLKLRSALRAGRGRRGALASSGPSAPRAPVRYTQLVQRALAQLHDESVAGLTVMQRQRRMPSAHSNLQIAHHVLTHSKADIRRTPFNVVRRRVQEALDRLVDRSMVKTAGSEHSPNLRKYRLPVSLPTGPLSTAGECVPKIHGHIVDMPADAKELVVHARIVAGLKWKLPEDMPLQCQACGAELTREKWVAVPPHTAIRRIWADALGMEHEALGTSEPAAICYAHFLESIYDAAGTGNEGVLPLRANAVPTMLQTHMHMKAQARARRECRPPAASAASSEQRRHRLRIACLLCSSTFNKRSRYKKHMASEHAAPSAHMDDDDAGGGEEAAGHRKSAGGRPKEHRCDACEAAFINESKLAQHKQALHDIHPEWLLATLAEDELRPKMMALWRSGVYQCPRCSMLMSNLNYLRKHVETRHAGEPYCGRTLREIVEHSYSSHLHRIESGELPPPGTPRHMQHERKPRAQRLCKTIANYCMLDDAEAHGDGGGRKVYSDDDM